MTLLWVRPRQPSTNIIRAEARLCYVWVPLRPAASEGEGTGPVELIPTTLVDWMDEALPGLWTTEDRRLPRSDPDQFANPKENNSMVPKRRFWKAEQRVACAFLKCFSNERSPNRVLTYVKSALKIRSRMSARPSKIFVWGPYNYLLGRFPTLSARHI